MRKLTRTERERISDSRMKLQSVAETLTQVDPKKVHDFAEIQDCLNEAEKNLSDALNSDIA